MSKQIVLTKKGMYFTYLEDIFHGIGDIANDYNWLLADYECSQYPDKTFEDNRYRYLWLSGQELLKYVDVQFIWGIIIAFKKDIKREDALMFGIPSGHLNHVTFQNPLSELEIYAFDSTGVYIMSRNDKYIDRFLLKYPEAEEYNND